MNENIKKLEKMKERIITMKTIGAIIIEEIIIEKIIIEKIIIEKKIIITEEIIMETMAEEDRICLKESSIYSNQRNNSKKIKKWQK